MLKINTSRGNERTICDYCKKSGDCDRQESVSGLHRKIIEILNDTLGNTEGSDILYRGMAITVECSHPDFEQFKPRDWEPICGSAPLTGDTGDKTTTSADYKKILDKQLQLLIEEQGKGFLIDIHDRIVNLAKNLLVLNPADSPSEF